MPFFPLARSIERAGMSCLLSALFPSSYFSKYPSTRTLPFYTPFQEKLNVCPILVRTCAGRIKEEETSRHNRVVLCFGQHCSKPRSSTELWCSSQDPVGHWCSSRSIYCCEQRYYRSHCCQQRYFRSESPTSTSESLRLRWRSHKKLDVRLLSLPIVFPKPQEQVLCELSASSSSYICDRAITPLLDPHIIVPAFLRLWYIHYIRRSARITKPPADSDGR